jgi:hypothetical protein
MDSNMKYPAPASPRSMAILDPATLVWSEPKLKNPNIPKLAAHSATAIYKHMIVAFGKLNLF